MAGHDPTLALLIGGRSGSGKSSVAHEIHKQLSSAGVMHACVEGDNLDLAYPPPWGRGLAEQNLAALGSSVSITAVLLTARDATIRGRWRPGRSAAGFRPTWNEAGPERSS
jgi:hypothetical protein